MQAFELVLMLLGALAALCGLITAVVQVYKWYQWKRGITWDDALHVAEELLKRIEVSSWKPEIVIGVGRSGGIWGGWIAGNLGSLPFAVVDDRFVESETGRRVDFPGCDGVLSSLRETYGDKKRALVIEGASSTGQTPREFLDKFKEGLAGWDVKTAVLYKNVAASTPIDFVGKDDLIPWPTDPKPFPWHHRALYRPFLGQVVSRRVSGRSVNLAT